AGPDLGVLARDVGVVDAHVALARTPERRPAGPDDEPLAVDDHDAAAGARDARLGELLVDPVRRAVDHRVPVVGLLDGAARRGADGPGLDAEFSERELLVRAELDGRAAHQRQALAARVLEQVAGEL